MSEGFSGLVRKVRQHRGIVANFSYLSGIQVISLLITLATYPYLIRVLGKDLFGTVVYAQAIITYLVVLVSFGFQISATREISVHRADPEKLNEIVSSTLILKGLLFLLSFGLLFLLFAFFPALKEHRVLFYLTMFTCFYEFIFPSWFFQGIEKMGYITIITLVLKVTFFILIFVFIREAKDYLLVPLFNGIGSVMAGLVSLWIVFKKEKIRFSFQPLGTLVYHFKESSLLFITNFANQVYVNANKVIVGITLGMAEVALYDLAEKIVLALKLPHNLLNQSVFPKISKERDLVFTRKLLFLSLATQIVLYGLIVLSSQSLIQLLGGPEMSDSTNLLRLLALTVPINAFSSYLGIQYLVARGFKRGYSRVVVGSVIVYFVVGCMLYVLGWMTLYGVVGMTIVTELYVLGAMLFLVRRKRRLGLI